jgi:hypothetical protein
LHTFVTKLPVLDASESSVFDAGADCWATEPAQTAKTKKIPRNHVKAEATEKHPAQVEVYYDDVVVGTWRTVKFSGALPTTMGPAGSATLPTFRQRCRSFAQRGCDRASCD